MSYYLDQLAEQERQQRLADLLQAGELGSFPAFVPQPDYRDARDLGAISTGGGLPPDYDFGPPVMLDAPPSDMLPPPQYRGESMAATPQRPFLRDLATPQSAPLPQNYIRNERTGAVTDLGPSQSQRAVGDFGQVAVETPFGKGRYMKGDNTRVVLNDGRIVDLGRDTAKERAIEKENLALQKQRAELAQMQAKPTSEYDKAIAQERAKRDIFASMPPAMREAEEVKRLGIKLKPGERYNMDKGEIELIPGSVPYNKQAGEVREESIGLKGLDRVIGNMLDRISTVEKAPGLSSAVGFWDAATPPIMSLFNAEDKATARSYITNLQEYLETKGLADLRASGVAPGSITEKEWSKFRTMVGNIDPTMDEKSFQKELNNLKQYAANARAEAAAKEVALKKQYGPVWEKYAVSSGQPADSAPQSAVQGVAVRVGSVNEAMKLKSGTRFIDPNGVERVRP